MAGPPKQPRNELIAVWFAVGLIFALFIGAGAGVLAWMGKQPVATAILTGFAAFGGTVTLAILVINLFRQGPSS